jgi:hypothetical protein
LIKTPKIYDEEKTASSTNFARKTGYLQLQETETRSMSFTLINSKGIKNFNIRPETLKLVQERVGDILELIGIGNNFLNRIQMVQQLREKIDYIKLKGFCTTKEMVTRLMRQPTEWEKIFASYISDKELINRIYRELKKKKTKLLENQ